MEMARFVEEPLCNLRRHVPNPREQDEYYGKAQAEPLAARPGVYTGVAANHSLPYYLFGRQYLQASRGHLKANAGLAGIAQLFVGCYRLLRVLHSSGSNSTRCTYGRSNFALAFRDFPWFAQCARNIQTTLPLWGSYWYLDGSNLRKNRGHNVHLDP